MRLIDLCYDLIEIPIGTGKISVTGLCVDSRRVRRGDLFFAIDGTHYDGRDYIKDAIAAGAVTVVTHNISLSKPLITIDQSCQHSSTAMR